MALRPDFVAQESALFAFTVDALKRFVAVHSDEFAYFAFDCNADYGEVFLCLDTSENSRKEAARTQSYITAERQRKHDYDAPDHQLQLAIHCLGNDVSGFVLPFGNNTGDFSHQGFAEIHFDDWESFSLAEQPLGDSQSSRISCVAVILMCNVIDRLVAADAFESLRRSKPFYCGLGLHDGVQRVVRMIDLPGAS